MCVWNEFTLYTTGIVKGRRDMLNVILVMLCHREHIQLSTSYICLITLKFIFWAWRNYNTHKRLYTIFCRYFANKDIPKSHAITIVLSLDNRSGNTIKTYNPSNAAQTIFNYSYIGRSTKKILCYRQNRIKSVIFMHHFTAKKNIVD